jgi:hypothetical protein
VIRPFSSSITRRSGRSSSSGPRASRAAYNARQHAHSGLRVDSTNSGSTGGAEGSISGIEQGEEETSTTSSRSSSIAACASS